MNPLPTENLLKSVSVIIEEEKREELRKGEKFNIFSILRMEFKENDTHSAFLGELLNPSGSHLKGSLFLELFLEEIEAKYLDTNSAQVILEKSIGPVIINEGTPLKSSGGRIDIYLEDSNRNSISIENKLNAPEQRFQVVRYYNFNRSKNKVYYLTISGATPSSYSTHNLIASEDYYEISYSHHIINWLEKCIMKLPDASILRGSIRQYLILLQKITGKMDSTYKDKLIHSILSNFETAENIVLNLDEARKVVCHDIFECSFTQLKEIFAPNTDLEVIKGNSIDHKHSQIWIKPFNQKDRVLWFVIESFSGNGHFNGNMFMGILNPPPHESKYKESPNQTSLSNWIINKRDFSKLQGYNTNLKDAQTVQKIYTDKIFKTEFVNHICKEVKEYIDQELPNLKIFLKTGKLPTNHELISNE